MEDRAIVVIFLAGKRDLSIPPKRKNQFWKTSSSSVGVWGPILSAKRMELETDHSPLPSPLSLFSVALQHISGLDRLTLDSLDHTHKHTHAVALF